MADQDSAPPIFIVDTSSWSEIERHPAENRILSALVPMIEAGRKVRSASSPKSVANQKQSKAFIEPPANSVATKTLRTSMRY
jgi:hypothetical protein